MTDRLGHINCHIFHCPVSLFVWWSIFKIPHFCLLLECASLSVCQLCHLLSICTTHCTHCPSHWPVVTAASANNVQCSTTLQQSTLLASECQKSYFNFVLSCHFCNCRMLGVYKWFVSLQSISCSWLLTATVWHIPQYTHTVSDHVNCGNILFPCLSYVFRFWFTYLFTSFLSLIIFSALRSKHFAAYATGSRKTTALLSGNCQLRAGFHIFVYFSDHNDKHHVIIEQKCHINSRHWYLDLSLAHSL